MSLDVIGAGFGRTGTLSLKMALEQLGFAPCHHMVEVIAHPEQAPVWHAAAEGNPPDWAAFLEPYRAAVDWPSCHFWRALSEAFPKAKIVLTARDAEAWYKSISQTILRELADPSKFPADEEHGARPRMAYRIVIEQTFGGRLDKAHMLDVYRAHIETVTRTLPKERLLVYDVKEGWAPLCGFLGVPVPESEFPRSNSTEEFIARVQARENAQKR